VTHAEAAQPGTGEALIAGRQGLGGGFDLFGLHRQFRAEEGQ
jgi:hypothetical protein